MWQTDFTYFKIIGWDWYYLSTILDYYSRYIIHWELYDSMKADDVKRTVDTVIVKARLKTKRKPILLSDNGPCYVSNDLKKLSERRAGYETGSLKTDASADSG